MCKIYWRRRPFDKSCGKFSPKQKKTDTLTHNKMERWGRKKKFDMNSASSFSSHAYLPFDTCKWCVSGMALHKTFLPLFSSFSLLKICLDNSYQFNIHRHLLHHHHHLLLLRLFLLLLIVLLFLIHLTIVKQICTLVYEWKCRAYIFYYYICQSLWHRGHTHAHTRILQR